MGIWAILFIPFFFSIFLYLKFRQETVWWEYMLVFVISVGSIVISKVVIETSQTSDTEYWGGYAVDTRHYERWNEYIHKTCTRTVSCGKNCTSTVPYDCSYVQNHPEYWVVTDSNGETVRISKSKYERLLKQFKVSTPELIDMRRNSHTIDGDMYKGAWNRDMKTLEPVVTSHSYENRVRVSSSILALSEPPESIFKEFKLFHYPEIYDDYRQPVLLGYEDEKGEKALQLINATLGAMKQFKMFVMVYNTSDRNAGLWQKDQWQGGNKNEFNVTIGIDSVTQKVLWCETFSWTDVTSIGVDTRKFLEDQDTLDLVSYARFIAPIIKDDWVRFDFEEFNYLTVEPKTNHIILAAIANILACIVVSLIVTKNRARVGR